MKRDLYTARRIMYGNIRRNIPDVSLDDDRLDGSFYEGIWSSDFLNALGINAKIYSRCDDIFKHRIDVQLALKKS